MMAENEREFEERIEFAYYHTIQEMGLDHIQPSFELEFEELQKAHDAIHELVLLGGMLFPTHDDREISWHSKTAFFVYQWEASNQFHRSLAECLCAYYNTAFVLLRVGLETILKGAFWQCISRSEYRQDSTVLDEGDAGRNLKGWLSELVRQAPETEQTLAEISASIYDETSSIIEDRDFRPSFRTIIRQLDQWGIFVPIPKPVKSVYRGIYAALSADVHAATERIDVYRRILGEQAPVFGQEMLPDALREYAASLHEVMDVAILVQFNIMGDLVRKSAEVRANLGERLATLEQLGLDYSLARARQLVENA